LTGTERPDFMQAARCCGGSSRFCSICWAMPARSRKKARSRCERARRQTDATGSNLPSRIAASAWLPSSRLNCSRISPRQILWPHAATVERGSALPSRASSRAWWAATWPWRARWVRARSSPYACRAARST